MTLRGMVWLEKQIENKNCILYIVTDYNPPAFNLVNALRGSMVLAL